LQNNPGGYNEGINIRRIVMANGNTNEPQAPDTNGNGEAPTRNPGDAPEK